MMKQLKSHSLVLKWSSVALLFCSATAFAAAAGSDAPKNVTTIQDIAGNITGSFDALGQLMIAVAYLAGIGFTIASIFKFKQHKDNPTQIPIGTPLAMLVIGIVLIFMPMIIKPAGTTIFGAKASQSGAGGFKGGGVSALPTGGGSS